MEKIITLPKLELFLEKCKALFAFKKHTHAASDITGLPDADSNAHQTANEALQRADEALEATNVTDPTNGGYPTSIGVALNNVYVEAYNHAYEANTAAYNAQQRADEAYNHADEANTAAYNAQQRADEAYNHADEAYNKATNVTVTDPIMNQSDTPINEALSNLNNKINSMDGTFLFVMIIMSQAIRDFTADLSLIGNERCFSISSDKYNNIGLEINDELMNEMYLIFKSGDNIDAGNVISNYIYENTSRKVTLTFDGVTLPTLKMTNVSYPDYNLDIIIDDVQLREMIASQLGLSDVVSLRMLEEPVIVGDNNDACYWALVTQDGFVHNPGTY